jgi:hypothetical protein
MFTKSVQNGVGIIIQAWISFFFILKNWTDIEKIGDERSRAEHKEIHQ